MPKIAVFQGDGKKVDEYEVDTIPEVNNLLQFGEEEPFRLMHVTRVDDSKNPVEVFSDDIIMCSLCNNTGNEKVGDTKTTVRPCPNGCKPDPALSHPSDAENPDNCILCNNTGVTATGLCHCKSSEQLQSGR
jgi:hypothetical protein